MSQLQVFLNELIHIKEYGYMNKIITAKKITNLSQINTNFLLVYEMWYVYFALPLSSMQKKK